MVAINPWFVGRGSPSRTCRHLAPLERLLAAAGRAVGPGRPCPHDAEWGTWFRTEAALDLNVVTKHVRLDACVRGEAYQEALSYGGDVTFYCAKCKQAIVGRLPRPQAPSATPRA